MTCRGRPSLPVDERRSELLSVRLAPDEMQYLLGASEARRQRLSVFVRAAIMAAAARAHGDDAAPWCTDGA
jgi:hypothetical protein